MPVPVRSAPKPPVRMSPAAEKALVNAFSAYVGTLPAKRRPVSMKNMAIMKRIQNKISNANVRKNFENWAKNKNLSKFKNNSNIMKSFVNSNYFMG
jgi:hypothetical protein